MAETILQTKLFIPSLRSTFVGRPRLLERLDQGQRQGCKLSLISAPAGYGKSSLIAEWIQQSRAEGRPIQFAWLSLDDSHNDPGRFLNYFMAALQSVIPGAGRPAVDLLRSSQASLAESFLVPVLNEIAVSGDEEDGNGRRYILVLDDYHTITAQGIQDILIFLLDHLPPSLHLVIGSRTDPPWPLSRLRVGGQITELRPAELAFTLEESGQFLNGVMALKLSAPDLLLFHRRTEGWIAGLQLAALSMRGLNDEDRHAFAADFAGSNRYIVDYLADEVLAALPESTREFLQQSSILDRLSGPLCDAVTGLGDGQRTLESLERANLFIIPLDEEHHWYRYHHLFADLLQRRLSERSPALAPELHRRAGIWYENNGLPAPAIEHALAAGDGERAAGLVERALDQTMMRGEFISLLEWLDSLPAAAVQQRPRLNAYYAIVLLLAGRPLEEVVAKQQSAAEADTAGILAGELTLLQALLATIKGEGRRSYTLSLQALELLPETNRFLWGLLFRNLGAVYKMTGDVKAALWAIEESAGIARKAGDRLGIIVTNHQMAEMAYLQGQLREAMALCRQGLELAMDSEGSPPPPAIKLLVTMADLYREWNDLETAERHLTQAIELAGRQIELWAMGAHIILARVRQAQGQIDGMHEALQIARRMAVAFDLSEVDDLFVAAQQSRLWLMEGNLEGAGRWAKERELDVEGALSGTVEAGGKDGTPYHVREYELITLARLYLAQGRSIRALELLAPLKRAAEKLGRSGIVIEIKMLQALAWKAEGELDRALVLLQATLALAEPGGYQRLFVDMGPSMKDLLQRAAVTAGGRPGRETDYLARLLAAFGEAAATSPAVSASVSRPAPQIQPLIEPLSERELEVLRLLTTHLSSTEMAAELGISANTVRFHTKNIYSKLNVHRRAEAVERGRELGLV